MREEYLRYLVCPSCQDNLEFADIRNRHNDIIETAVLKCLTCGARYDIVDHIPRFAPSDNYASSFGYEWTKHARTQYDSYSGTNVSETRFFKETKWPRHLKGEVILEVGCGSGRFTEQAATTDAMVISLDYSPLCCQSNYSSNGAKANVLIVQGNLYHMPFRPNFFDKLFCFGVLQHTPDVERAFMTLPCFLRSRGSLAIDVYKDFGRVKNLIITKYWVRPVTKRLRPETLYALCKKGIEIMWPVAKLIDRLPQYHAKLLTQLLLIADYRGLYDLPEELLKEWAILDTFDMLSPAYDQPQTLRTVQNWFRNAKLLNWEVTYGYNGIEGRGVKP
jgi:ubiquinone/menaquinone biosynthesis C-methylase UbiE/uncharacterized protein YbaR (Trm112 family)